VLEADSDVAFKHQKIETRIGGGAAIRVSGGCGWGDPHANSYEVQTLTRSKLLRGQRITVTLAASATAQAVTKVFAGAVQLVT